MTSITNVSEVRGECSNHDPDPPRVFLKSTAWILAPVGSHSDFVALHSDDQLLWARADSASYAAELGGR